MLKIHHVNLGIVPSQLDAEARFLVEVLGMSRVEPPAEFADRARWFECDDAVQVHLSEEDPAFTPSLRSHVAMRLGDDLGAFEERARAAGLRVEPTREQRPDVVICIDPGGHRWELRAMQ